MITFSLKYRISGTVFLLVASVLAVVLSSTLASYFKYSRAQLDKYELVILEMLSQFAREALLTGEYELFQPHLERITDNVHVVSAHLYDEGHRLVASSASALKTIPQNLPKADLRTYWKTQQIVGSSGIYGTLAVEFSNHPMVLFHSSIQNRSIILAILGSLLISAVAVLAGHILTRRLNTVTNAAAGFANGRFDIKTRLTGSDEISILGQTFDSMVDSIVFSQQQLREQVERTQLLMDSTAEAIYGIDTDGRCIFVNRACLRVLDYQDASDLIGRNMQTLLHQPPDGAQESTGNGHGLQEVIRSGIGIHIDDERIWRADGRSFSAECWSYPMLKNEVIVGAVVAFIDVTERKKAEHALRQSEVKLRSLTENTPDHIMLVALDGAIMFINHTAPGLTKEKVLNTSIYSYSTPEYQERAKNCFDKVLRSGVPDQYETVFTDNNGVVHYFDVRVGPVLDGKLISAFAVAARNITQRKKVELELKSYKEKLEELVSERTVELLNANQELEAFSYSVSHDLRGPLRAIDGFSSLLASEYTTKLDDTGKDYLKRIRKGCQRMGLLIDDLLSLAKVSRYELRRETIDLSELARQVYQQLTEGESGKIEEFVVTPGLNAEADPRLIRQVLENLLSNAKKYTATIPNARIEFGATDYKGVMAYFVRDNGVGFDMQFVHKLFKAFQRLHTEQEFPGSGIGLATVARIIQRHGGRVWAESDVSRGASFFFTLDGGENG